MSTSVRVALMGATGYTGVELLRLLRAHPRAQINAIYGHSTAGKSLAEVVPAFAGVDLPDVRRFDAGHAASVADFTLLAVPHGTAQDAAAALLAAGTRVIDLSADHRFDDPSFYARVYREHAHPASLAQTVYGLVERHREAIRTTRLVGCAGCYPTSVILAAGPAVDAGRVSGEIIADCKSGVSGAGRKPSAGTHFPETSEGLHAYKTLAHRHAPEIGRALDGRTVHFVPHLVPMNRGILSTVYLRVDRPIEAMRAIYDAAYGDEPFVTVLPAGAHPDTRNVRGTNRCHLGLFQSGDLLVVQAAIDNLGKGAAGQAVQCLNLMAGLEETTGLEHTALFP